MKKISIAILTFILAFALFGCTVPVDIPEPNKEDIANIIEANNQFALDLYSQFKDDKNMFFSPWSISTALTMTYEGAKGQTAEEMKSVLHLPDNQETIKTSYYWIQSEINKEPKSYKLHTANALWAQQDYQFLQEYTDPMQKYYSAKITNLDFKTKTEESRITINKWVEKKTNNKIKDLISQGALSSLTRLVLTNAIYFKGTWLKQFDKKDTQEKDFHVTPEKTVKVDMMALTDKEAKFNYAETDNLQILELPYDGEELSMLLLLPKDNINSLENSLTAEKLSGWKQLLIEQRVKVFLPRFKFETKYLLAKDLVKMGMPTAFSPGVADFSGMDGTNNLFISGVIHQAFVEVNEEGTEAAAATAVIMELKAMPEPIPTFIADHPFLFIIQETKTGNILFLGKVADPS